MSVSLFAQRLALCACGLLTLPGCPEEDEIDPTADSGISNLDGGTLDGGARDGGALDGGALDGGALDGGALDGSPDGGGAADTGAADTGSGQDANIDAGLPDADVGSDAGVLGAGDFDPSTIGGMAYRCVDSTETTYVLSLFSDGTLEFDGQAGTYSLAGSTISMSIPSVGFVETSTDHRIALERLAIFVTPSLYCFAITTNLTVSSPTVVNCPSIHHIPGVSFEENQFHLSASGNVFWRNWLNLVSPSDQIYSARSGIWIQEGDRIAMFFGSPYFPVETLTGTYDLGDLLVDTLEPSAGACR